MQGALKGQLIKTISKVPCRVLNTSLGKINCVVINRTGKITVLVFRSVREEVSEVYVAQITYE